MGSTCGKVAGLAVLLAGLALFAYANGNLGGQMAHYLAGVLFVVYGLAKLVHAANACPACNASEKHG
ncbi:hypothetical protein AUJ14_03970 [Candidatus Micrarchaeota archaeon CG1_02_55_22]|nr:MAG: hypothetical protein AUJ14_03970 [Candidatus Micrarchaeota archaeon CG1_02_55_22]